MPDVYTTVADQDDAVVEQLAAAMELRARDPRQRAFVDEYLTGIELPPDARIVEIGCGTGAIARLLAGRPGVGEVVGVDPSPGLIRRAKDLATGSPSVTFHVADGAATPLPDATADAVVLHTVLSHAPHPDALLHEAHRLLRAGGTVAVFDGDYSTMTLSIAASDPLQCCVVAFQDSYINDCWVMRRAAAMMRAAGFEVARVESHGFVQIEDPAYTLTVADRGADALAVAGVVAKGTADALKAEARRRVEEGTFYGHVAYTSVIGRKGPA